MDDIFRVTKNENVKSVRNKLRRQYRVMIINAKKRANSDYISASNNKCKAAWSIINKKRNTKDNMKKGVSIDAQSFNDYFVEAAAGLRIDCNIAMEVRRVPSSFSFAEVSCITVRDAINSLRGSRSRDIYGLNVELLKFIKDLLISPLTKQINKIIREGIYPQALKISKVVPIYKNGDNLDCSNYRPISLIPVISKVVEKILFEQILHYLNENELLSSKQYGFTRGISTSDAIIALMSQIVGSREMHGVARACFIDLSKAFDCVPHTRLVSKLRALGFGNTSAGLMESYLCGREQFVWHENELSHGRGVCCGVLQGSTLGPLLFLIYINDFVEHVSSAEVVLFADDTTLVAFGDTVEEASDRLAIARDEAQRWFWENGLTLNDRKTSYMTFPTAAGGIVDESVRFLGVQIDPGLKWGEHCESVANKVSRGVFVLRSLKDEVSVSVLRMAYFALVHAHLTYALATWGHSAAQHRIFGLQRRAVRLVADLGYRDDCRDSFKTLEILTLPSMSIHECVKYLKKINPNLGCTAQYTTT